jgi:hypothetical protein
MQKPTVHFNKKIAFAKLAKALKSTKSATPT